MHAALVAGLVAAAGWLGGGRGGAAAGVSRARLATSACRASTQPSPPAPSGSSWLGAGGDVDEERRRESKLEAWLTSQGVYLAAQSSWGQAPHPLGIATQTKDSDLQDSGRGLLATRGVRQGDPLFRVPENVCMTRARAAKELGADVVHGGLGEHEALALLLMRERHLGDASFWSPYVDVLPASADDVDASWAWSDAELEMLAGSSALNEAREFQKRIADSYAELAAPAGPIDTMVAKGLAPAAALSEAQFKWAMAVLFSRAINMRAMDALVLAPYADLLNHSPASNAIFEAEKPFLSDEHEIVCYADRQYGKMEQVGKAGTAGNAGTAASVRGGAAGRGWVRAGSTACARHGRGTASARAAHTRTACHASHAAAPRRAHARARPPPTVCCSAVSAPLCVRPAVVFALSLSGRCTSRTASARTRSCCCCTAL